MVSTRSMTKKARSVEAAAAAANLDPVGDADLIPFVLWALRIARTTRVDERLVHHGLGTVVDGTFAPRADLLPVLAPIDLAERLAKGGATPREVVERLADDAAAAGATPGGSTFVVYAIYRGGELTGTWADAASPIELGIDADGRVYVGETVDTCDRRKKSHPRGCPKLVEAFESTPGGKDAWTCRPVVALPERARHKELLLYIEGRLQRALDTVDGAWGLNVHYAAGRFGGARDEGPWLASFVAFVRFVRDNGKFPSVGAEDPDEKKLGQWVNHQRSGRAAMPTHRVRALEAVRCWAWRVKAPPMTTKQKLDFLATSEIVRETGGWLFPRDGKGHAVFHMRQALRGTGNCVVTPEDRERVERDFPGLLLTAPEATFRYNATRFAAAYLNAETGEIEEPRWCEDPWAYDWLFRLRGGSVETTGDRRAFLGTVGLGALLETFKNEDKRAEVAKRNAERWRESTAEVGERRKQARTEKERVMKESIAMGPRQAPA